MDPGGWCRATFFLWRGVGEGAAEVEGERSIITHKLEGFKEKKEKNTGRRDKVRLCKWENKRGCM